MSKTILKIFLISYLLCNLAYSQDVKRISLLVLDQIRDVKNADVITYAYNNQTLEGYYQIYAKADNDIISEGQFENGKRVGLHRSYSSITKSVNSEITYRDGIRNGTVKFFYLDGQLQSDGIYKNGLAEGLYREYSEKGALIKKIKFKGGLRLWQKEYYEDGKLLKLTLYKNGEVIKEKRYDENGRSLKPKATIE